MKILIKTRLISWFGLLALILNAAPSYGQDCESDIEFQLKNIAGGFFPDQKVSLTNKADGKTFIQSSDKFGVVAFKVPCNTIFDLTISNYADKSVIKSPAGGRLKRTLAYESNMIALSKAIKMTPAEISKVDFTANQLPDTTYISGSKMKQPIQFTHFSLVNLALKDIHGKPLINETITFSASKRNKHFKGTTDLLGNMVLYLIKGDKYFVNFKHNKDFISYEFDYTKGTSKVDITFSYLGTREIEKRKKEEELRIVNEEKRLKEKRVAFEAECKRLGISIEEGYLRASKEYSKGFTDTVITKVLNRNKWINKLIVCDLTGSMQPYAHQLGIWYQLNLKKEQNLQFVFFNDGDNKSDNEKIIGETGGIYYSPSEGIVKLNAFIAHVSSRGYGGDCAENNMEALIKGVKLAKPFTELIAIVDNNAPVKDISLLKTFNQPVHIILCGATDGWVLKDYLLIAWKTKGSIHTIEQDITNIAKMSEGQEIQIGGIIYRIMGGEFVRINKL